MVRSSKNQVSLQAAEHIGPDDTGDNIEAKRVAPYAWNGNQWERSSSALTNVAHDQILFTNPDGGGNYQTATYKLNSSTVLVLTFAYDGNNNVTSITRA